MNRYGPGSQGVNSLARCGWSERLSAPTRPIAVESPFLEAP